MSFLYDQVLTNCKKQLLDLEKISTSFFLEIRKVFLWSFAVVSLNALNNVNLFSTFELISVYFKFNIYNMSYKGKMFLLLLYCFISKLIFYHTKLFINVNKMSIYEKSRIIVVWVWLKRKTLFKVILFIDFSLHFLKKSLTAKAFSQKAAGQIICKTWWF